MLEIARLHLKQIVAGRRLWLLGLTLAAPIALVLTITIGSDIRNHRAFEFIAGAVLFSFYAIGVSSLTALLYGTSIIGAEVQNQTLTYLFTRPIRRWRVVVGKYIANVTVLCTGIVASLLIAWTIFAWPLFNILGAVLVAVVAATIAYNAVFTLIGSIFTRKPLVFGMIYIVVIEVVLALVPSFARNFTVMYHVRTLAFQIAELDVRVPAEALAVIGEAPALESAYIIAGITLGALVLTSRITTQREFALTDEP